MRTPFDVDLVNAALITLPGHWREIEFHPALSSTNDEIRRAVPAWGGASASRPDAAQAVPDARAVWRVVLTDHQTGVIAKAITDYEKKAGVKIN
ncbi:MAG: hypothetical protein L0H79_15630, partial [Intrasporangium sp.]|nr:hypothetical protein [Intrasporangium sp.]